MGIATSVFADVLRMLLCMSLQVEKLVGIVVEVDL